jgi:hypothetical protein
MIEHISFLLSTQSGPSAFITGQLYFFKVVIKTFAISMVIPAYIILTFQMQISTECLRNYLIYLPFYVLRYALMNCFLSCELQNTLSFSFPLSLLLFNKWIRAHTQHQKQFILFVCNQPIKENHTRLISFQDGFGLSI